MDQRAKQVEAIKLLKPEKYEPNQENIKNEIDNIKTYESKVIGHNLFYEANKQVFKY